MLLKCIGLTLVLSSPCRCVQLRPAGRIVSGIGADVADHEIRVVNSQRARQVDGIGAPARVAAGQLTRMLFDRGGQFDWAGGRPVLISRQLGGVQVMVVEFAVARGSSHRGSHPSRNCAASWLPASSTTSFTKRLSRNKQAPRVTGVGR